MDYSVRVSHLDRNQIKSALGSMVNVGQNMEKLRKTLAKQRKDQHPIHKMVNSFTNSELNGMLGNLCLPIPKHRPRKMKAISDYFFREYPDAPLTNLKRVLEEDNYFAELTRVEEKDRIAGMYYS